MKITMADGFTFEGTQAEYEAFLETDEAKWAKIGRKPGEFKKGDIAKVIDSPYALPNGTIFTVSSVRGGDVYDDSKYSYVYMIPHKQLELITPVESTLK